MTCSAKIVLLRSQATYQKIGKKRIVDTNQKYQKIITYKYGNKFLIHITFISDKQAFRKDASAVIRENFTSIEQAGFKSCRNNQKKSGAMFLDQSSAHYMV